MNVKPLYEVRKIRNLKDMLNQSVELYGSKTAFLTKKKDQSSFSPVTYERFGKDVNSLGAALLALGLKDARIAVIGENRYEWVTAYLASVNGLGTIVPLDKELPENEIEHLLIRSEASAIIFSGKHRNHILSISSKTSLRFLIDMDAEKDDDNSLSYQNLLLKGATILESGDDSYKQLPIDENAMNILLFTSGTTDLAKGVCLSHNNICSNLMSMCTMINIVPTDTFLSVLPLHHTYECTCGFLCPIYRGAAVAFCEGLRHIVKNLQESKATVMLGVPLIFETMYKKLWEQIKKKKGAATKLEAAMKVNNFLKKTVRVDLSSKLFAPIHSALGGKVRLLIAGAAAIDPKVSKGFRDLGIGFLQGYGLTECAPILALNRDCLFKDDAAGLPLPGVEVKINEPGSDGIGEIIAKGPNVMLGYFNNDMLTSNILKDGWFYTGDLGYIDSDGFVHITGRKKNVIVTKNGKNIFPEEVESYLNRSPYILESLVYGKNDESSGDLLVCASIVPDMEKIKEELPDTPVEVDALRPLIDKEVKKINRNMPLYKHIYHFDLRENEFAKTTTKKIKRYLETNQ